jgi:hypothetical protein
MVDREQMVMDLLCGELQTAWSYCDPSCISCKFYHEESDMGARVSICVHGFGSSKESCGCYMTQREYLDFVRSGFANLKAENDKLREAVATAIKVQAMLCGDADRLYCRRDCPLHRQESDDCLACDVIDIAQELGIEVD